MRYIDADKCDAAMEAHRNNISHDVIAGHLGITIDELRVVLGLPQWKAEPAKSDESFDLWAADRLDAVL